MFMARSIWSLYYIYERSGSRLKHMLDEGCQPQVRYILFPSKEGSIYGLYTHVNITVIKCRFLVPKGCKRLSSI